MRRALIIALKCKTLGAGLVHAYTLHSLSIDSTYVMVVDSTGNMATSMIENGHLGSAKVKKKL